MKSAAAIASVVLLSSSADAADWPSFLPIDDGEQQQEQPNGFTDSVMTSNAADVSSRREQNRITLEGYLNKELCRFNDETNCLSGSDCVWCQGRCTLKSVTPNCAETAADEAKFEEELKKLFEEEAAKAAAATATAAATKRGVNPLFSIVKPPCVFPCDDLDPCGLPWTDPCFPSIGDTLVKIALLGEDLRTVNDVFSVEKCLSACEAEAKCAGWTFSPPQNCLLKKTVTGILSSWESTSGYRTDQSLMLNTDVPGSDIRRIVVTKYEDCKTACTLDPVCRAWTYDGSVTGCWLKNVIPGRVVKLGVVSGVVDAKLETLPPVPAPVAPPAPSCGGLCRGIQRLCKFLLRGDMEDLCLTVAPYLTSFNSWKNAKNGMVNMWNLWKGGGKDIPTSFQVVFLLCDKIATGSIGAKLVQVYNKLKDAVNKLIQKVLEYTKIVVNSIRATILGLQITLFQLSHPMSMSPNGYRACARCTVEFDYLHELMGADNSCAKMITSQMWAGINVYWIASNPIYGVTSSGSVLTYSLCSGYNQFYCTAGITCEKMYNTKTFYDF